MSAPTPHPGPKAATSAPMTAGSGGTKPMIDYTICYPCRLKQHQDCLHLTHTPQGIRHCQCDCKKRDEFQFIYEPVEKELDNPDWTNYTDTISQ